METPKDALVQEEASSPPPARDEAEELARLTRSLRRKKGFGLYFVQCNQSRERERLMKALQERLPQFRFQRFSVQDAPRNLLHALRGKLQQPTPNALFVYGLEDWLSSAVPPKSVPFLLNLNATRNHFIAEVPCSLVFWVPEYVLKMISQAAPDFFSVRSGVYAFHSSTENEEELSTISASETQTAMLGLSYEERQERLESLTKLLKNYEALPEAQRDYLAEATLLDRLATLHQVVGNYVEAEPLFVRALEIREKQLGAEHPDTAGSLNNLAGLYYHQGKYGEAAGYMKRALAIVEKALGPEHPNTKLVRENLEFLRQRAGR